MQVNCNRYFTRKEPLRYQDSNLKHSELYLSNLSLQSIGLSCVCKDIRLDSVISDIMNWWPCVPIHSAMLLTLLLCLLLENDIELIGFT